MTLLEKIEKKRDIFRRTQEKEAVSFFSYLIAKARAPGKNDEAGPRESTDAEVISVIRKIIKENNEVFELAKDLDTQTNLAWQNVLLENLLPKQMSEEELTKLLRSFVCAFIGAEKSMKSMGVIMNYLKENYSGQYDPQMASKIAKSLLT